MESILGSNKNIYRAGEIPNLKKIIRENFVSDGLLDFDKINNKINNKDNSIYDHYINDFNLKNIKENVVIDKNTENFKFLGIINAFFTNSKIINCVRNPLDNILSIYRANFLNQSFSFSLRDISNLYLNYFK